MRRRLVLIVLATTSLVVVAFAIPLGALVRSVAYDRAVAGAERDAAALSPVLGLDPSTDSVEAAVANTATGDDGRLAVWLPSGEVVGSTSQEDDAAVALARQEARAFSQRRDDGLALYTPVVTGTGTPAVVRTTVPADLLNRGVGTAWLALAGVALALVVAAAVIADRLARSVTRDATELSGTARALAAGRSEARAGPGTTPELGDAARALNLLADRTDELRAAERERVADLSHRLRTPLTALRLDAEAAGDAVLVADVERLEAAISELIHSARRPLHPGAVAASCDLVAVARDRALFWSALAEDDGRVWSLDVDGVTGPCPVSLSADEAGAAIDILVGNVFSHTDDGTPYTLRVGRDDATAHLTVEDGGEGLEAPHQAVGRGEAGGGSTGLGLDIARRAAEAAGGSITIDRSSLGGARVTLAFPLASDRLR